MSRDRRRSRCVLLGGAVELQAARERAYPPDAEATDAALYCVGRCAVRRAGRRLHTRWPPTSTGSARFSITAAPSSGSAATAALTDRAAGGARTARRRLQLLYPLLDITTTLDPRFNIAYRFGAIFLAEPIRAAPAGRTWRSRCSKRDCAHDPISGSTWRTSGSSTTGTLHDYQAAAEWFERGGERAGRAVVAAVAGGDHAARRAATGSRRALMWAADPCIGRDRLAAAGRRAPAAAVACARRDRRAADASSTPFSAHRRRRRPLGATRSRPACCPASRSIPAGTPYELDRTAASTCRARSPLLVRCPTNRPAPRSTTARP